MTIDGWTIEPVGEWRALAHDRFENEARQIVRAIGGGNACLYHRSRHAVTYLAHIDKPTGSSEEIYVKAYYAPRAAGALKQMVRGGRAGNAIRMTAALRRAGFNTPPLLMRGRHRGSGRTLVASARADGVALPDLLARLHRERAFIRKRGVLRALGAEVARMHRAGFIHGDLTPYNIFVVLEQAPRFVLLDHDRTRRAFVPGRGYRQMRNLVQLGRFDLPALSHTDRLRVLTAYAAGMGRMRWRPMARRLIRMLARRKARDARNGGGAK